MGDESDLHTYGIHPTPYMAGAATLLALTTIALAIRLFVRGYMLRQLGLDDLFLTISQAMFIIFCGSIIATASHQRDGGLAGFPVLKLVTDVIVSEASYILTMLFVKIALAFFYLRIVYKAWHRWLIYTCIGLYAAYSAVPFFLNMFQCGLPQPEHFLNPAACPVQWNVSGPVNYIAAATNAVADWVMTYIPVVVILHLQMPMRDKISALTLVAIGAAASAISVVRIPYMKSLRLTGDLYFFGNIELLGWLSVFECAIAITALCVAAYRPLWRGVPRNDKKSNYGRSRYGNGYGARSAADASRVGSISNVPMSSKHPNGASMLESGLQYPKGTTTTVVGFTGMPEDSFRPYKDYERGITREEHIVVSSEKI